MLDIPDDTGTGTNQEPLQVSFSIKGQSNGNTVYYLVKFYPDLSKIMYIEEIDASKVELAYNEKNTWGWPASWTDIDKLSTKRIEVTETGEKQIKVSFLYNSKCRE